ncbi:hypothetical protein H0H93_013130 [Arthromyces matolae]|nr:hypothetical protein H0H93_013130 [Arthromyces matolae]
MDWACRLLGLSEDFLNASGLGGGVIQTTASESLLVAIIAARSLYRRNHLEVPVEKLVIYVTTQTHSLGVKAGLILDIPVRVLEVEADDEYSLRGETLRAALEEDTKNGLVPLVVVATVGTTNTGAIDNIPEIQNVVKDYPQLWVHIDAAWAGSALACPELREKLHLNSINEFADSFCTNFHKWGLVNFDASTLWFRNRHHLTEALDVTPPFLRTKYTEDSKKIFQPTIHERSTADGYSVSFRRRIPQL